MTSHIGRPTCCLKAMSLIEARPVLVEPGTLRKRYRCLDCGRTSTRYFEDSGLLHADQRRRKSQSPFPGRVLAALDRGDMTRQELAAAVLLTQETLRRYLDKLLAQGRIHVCEYRRRDRGAAVQVFRLGPAPSGLVAEPPKRLSAAERSRRARERAAQCPPPALPVFPSPARQDPAMAIIGGWGAR